MAAVAEAKYGERIDAGWNGQRLEVPYLVTGATSRSNARATLIATAPSALAGFTTANGATAVLRLTDTRLDEVPGTSGSWNAWAIYTIPTYTSMRATGENAFQFDTGGNTQRVSQALKHISTASCAGATSTPNFRGAINVNGEGDVGGVDVPSPAFRFSVTMYKTKAEMSQSYLNTLYTLTGTVNNAVVTIDVDGQDLTFQPGELLLEGASGGMRGNEDWELTLRFAGSPNVADVCADWDAAVKPAAPVPKKGWEYVWIYYQEFYDQTTTPPRRVMRPQTVNVEQVYRTGTFSGLGLPQ